ncbi:MAG TPA: hypothetical protein VEL76_23365 [Gemmataceae bacterium]|nr:hypothetical protein [Gemmataceae bacterium]
MDWFWGLMLIVIAIGLFLRWANNQANQNPITQQMKTSLLERFLGKK